MRNKAFTLIELIIVLVIVAVIACIVIPVLAEPSRKPGTVVTVKSTHATATVIARDTRTKPTTWIVRIDNGPEANPRYTEARFAAAELETPLETPHVP